MVMTAGKHCLQTIPPPSSLIFLTWKHPEYFPHSPRARSAQRWCALQDRVSLDIFCRLAGESKDKWVEILKEKKKVWSERSKCEKITAPCKCGLVKSLAAKTEGSWKQLSPLVSNVFKFGFRNLSFWTSVTLPRRTLCNWHPDSRMWQPEQVRDCSRAAPCCGHP